MLLKRRFKCCHFFYYRVLCSRLHQRQRGRQYDILFAAWPSSEMIDVSADIIQKLLTSCQIAMCAKQMSYSKLANQMLS